jgi:hypothetical protein
MSNFTVDDLFSFCRSQARISASDFFDPRYARPEEVKAWRSEISRRNTARKKAKKRFGAFLGSKLSFMKVGRLSLSADGFDYVVGQYAPAEIYQAAYDFLVVQFS